MIGKQFGQFLVIDSVPTKGKSRLKYFRCLCSCGNTRDVPGSALRAGRRKSCGCSRQEHIKKAQAANKIKDRQDSAINRYMFRYKQTAEKRCLPFNLTREEFKQLVLQNCNYCGAEPSNVVKETSKTDTESFKFNGIDRVKNSEGYTLSNCVPCCKICNYAKGTLTQEEFFEHIRKIHSKSIQGK